MNPIFRWEILVGALGGMLSVAMGAFAAHGLKAVLDPQRLSTLQTASHYLMAHSLALILCCLWGQTLWPARLFAIGNLLFSGSLYLLALTGLPAFGWITPIGGVCYLLGWLLFALSARTIG